MSQSVQDITFSALLEFSVNIWKLKTCFFFFFSHALSHPSERQVNCLPVRCYGLPVFKQPSPPPPSKGQTTNFSNFDFSCNFLLSLVFFQADEENKIEQWKEITINSPILKFQPVFFCILKITNYMCVCKYKHVHVRIHTFVILLIL